MFFRRRFFQGLPSIIFSIQNNDVTPQPKSCSQVATKSESPKTEYPSWKLLKPIKENGICLQRSYAEGLDS
jgi:hypothetical protein